MRRTIFAICAVTLLCGAANPPSCSDQIATLNAQEAVYVTQDLAWICPDLDALDGPLRANTNGNVGKFLDNVELACPPHPAPTNIVVIALDIMQVAVALKPYYGRLSAAGKKAVANAQGIAAAHGIVTP